MASAQMPDLSDSQRAQLSDMSPIVIVGTTTSSVKLVNQEKKKIVPVPLPSPMPPELAALHITKLELVPVLDYHAGSLTNVRVTETLRTNDKIKTGDLIQVFVEEPPLIVMDDLPIPPFLNGQSYVLMLSPIAPDDPRLNANVVVDAPSPPAIVRTNIYEVRLGYYGVVNATPANQNLVNLIRQAVQEKELEDLQSQRQP
jgi:hypothetical protein